MIILAIGYHTSRSHDLLLFQSPMLHSQDLGVGQVKEPYIRVNTREFNRELYIGSSILYTKT